MEDRDLRYCKLCLATDVKMFSMNTPSIREAYSQLVQIVVSEAYQMYVCYECVSLLCKYQEFRTKCITALNVLSSINVDHSKITKEDILTINRKYYNLYSKYECCSMLLCNNNEQYKPGDCINEDQRSLKDEMDSDTKSKLVRPEIEFKNDAPVKVQDKIKIELDIPEIKYETDDKYRNLNEIFLESNDNDYVEETKKKQGPKSTKKKINTTKSSPDSQDNNESFSIEIVVEPNDYVPETKKKRKPVPKLKKKGNATTKIKQEPNSLDLDNKPLTKKSLKTKRKKTGVKKVSKPASDKSLFDNFKLVNKDYVTAVLLTPEDAKKEVLLRKESKNYKNNPYKCHICYKGFGTNLTLDNHMKKHSPEFGNLECEYCHIKFPAKNLLHRHKSSRHLYKFCCLLCPYVSYYRYQAEVHMNFHKGKKYTCNVCGLNFSKPATLHNHKNLKHPTECVCELCGDMFATERGLNFHKMKSHRQESCEVTGPKCEECDVQFATETAFKRHLVLSSKHTVRNGCEQCGDTFYDEKALKFHLRTHPLKMKKKGNVKLPSACKICGIWLTNNAEYEGHMTSLHPLTEQKKKVKSDSLICDVCGKVYKDPRYLQNHKFKHSSERFECRECGKTFITPSALYYHENTHTRERVFQCDLCRKEYTRKGALIKHIKGHLSLRPYVCSFCDKTFTHQYLMRMHTEYVHFKKPWPKRDKTKRRDLV